MKFLDVLRRNKPVVKEDWSKHQPMPEMTKIIQSKRYTTLDSKVIAQGLYHILFVPLYAWLFQTNKNHFFVVYKNTAGDLNLYPIESKVAQGIYETLPFQEVGYEQAFPDVTITDA